MDREDISKFYLVDVPGLGYAEVDDGKVDSWRGRYFLSFSLESSWLLSSLSLSSLLSSLPSPLSSLLSSLSSLSSSLSSPLSLTSSTSLSLSLSLFSSQV